MENVNGSEVKEVAPVEVQDVRLTYDLIVGVSDLLKERNPKATPTDLVKILRKRGIVVTRNKIVARIDQCRKQYQKNKEKYGNDFYDYEFPELMDENLPRGRKAVAMKKEERSRVFARFFDGL